MARRRSRPRRLSRKIERKIRKHWRIRLNKADKWQRRSAQKIYLKLLTEFAAEEAGLEKAFRRATFPQPIPEHYNIWQNSKPIPIPLLDGQEEVEEALNPKAPEPTEEEKQRMIDEALLFFAENIDEYAKAFPYNDPKVQLFYIKEEE